MLHVYAALVAHCNRHVHKTIGAKQHREVLLPDSIVVDKEVAKVARPEYVETHMTAAVQDVLALSQVVANNLVAAERASAWLRGCKLCPVSLPA